MLDLGSPWWYVGFVALFVLGLIMMLTERDEKLRAMRTELDRTRQDLDNTRQDLDDSRDELRSASLARGAAPTRTQTRPRTKPLLAAKRKIWREWSQRYAHARQQTDDTGDAEH